MDLVFSTDQYSRAQRYAAWRDAICDVYVHVDVKASDPDRYRGFIREAKLGDVVLTDILLSEQRIRRNRHHISLLDKDCYYVQLPQKGSISIVQRGATHRSNAARGGIFSATEEYELHGHGEVRSLYLEIPHDEFAQRFPRERVPVSASINSTRGLGRITSEFCTMLAAESATLAEGARTHLGNHLMDLIALTLLSAEGDVPTADGSIRMARLRSVQQWIEAHLGDPTLSLERIAGANGISLRYLHLLFKDCGMSVSEWIWDRRLQLTYDKLVRRAGQSITSIAFEHGFSSAAHFSTMFKRRFGMSPRDVAGSTQ
jgi:AraC-like DNA-binding protein